MSIAWNVRTHVNDSGLHRFSLLSVRMVSLYRLLHQRKIVQTWFEEKFLLVAVWFQILLDRLIPGEFLYALIFITLKHNNLRIRWSCSGSHRIGSSDMWIVNIGKSTRIVLNFLNQSYESDDKCDIARCIELIQCPRAVISALGKLRFLELVILHSISGWALKSGSCLLLNKNSYPIGAQKEICVVNSTATCQSTDSRGTECSTQTVRTKRYTKRI